MGLIKNEMIPSCREHFKYGCKKGYTRQCKCLNLTWNVQSCVNNLDNVQMKNHVDLLQTLSEVKTSAEKMNLLMTKFCAIC